MIIHKTGLVIADPSNPQNNGKYVKDIGLSELEKMLDSKQVQTKLTINGTEYFVISQKQADSDLIFASFITTNELYKTSSYIRWTIFSICILTLLIACILTYIGSGKISKPIVNTSAQVVERLGDRSKEIGQIVDTISGIAGQTNLLALNAAIEAARAGEQGRGFAVVAEEVRKLAEQSRDAAKKIEVLIAEIQVDTEKAVVAMTDGTREVKKGTEAVNDAGVAFREIADLVTQVSSQIKEISVAISETATGSQQIVSSVRKIDDLSKNAAGEAQSVSAATEEQLASMEEVASASQALTNLAEEMLATVRHFKI